MNIFLLGHACDLIEKHRNTYEKKSPISRLCTSLPSSRHHSVEDLTAVINSKSTPHTPTPSQSSSIADISTQAALIQDKLENSMILSNSTVSLNSLEINDGSNVQLLQDQDQLSCLKRRLNSADKLRRRVSLQETHKYN